MNNSDIYPDIELDLEEISRQICLQDADAQCSTPIKFDFKSSAADIAKTVTDTIPVVFALWAVAFLAKVDFSLIACGTLAFLYGVYLERIKRSNIFRAKAFGFVQDWAKRPSLYRVQK